MRLSFYICLVLTFISFSLTAATISGEITDQAGKPVPFANVYIQQSTIGVTANAEGMYTLKVNPGTYQVVFKTIGYKQLIKTITVTDQNITVDIELEQEIYSLKEVNVSSKQEDPAFEVVRNAIKNASNT